MLIFVNVVKPMKYPTAAKIKLEIIPADAINAKCYSVIS